MAQNAKYDVIVLTDGMISDAAGGGRGGGGGGARRVSALNCSFNFASYCQIPHTITVVKTETQIAAVRLK